MTSKTNSMRTFYIVWATQFISTMGTGLTAFAIGVWLFQQTQAVTPLAFLLLFKSLPVVLLSPLAGALVALIIVPLIGSALVVGRYVHRRVLGLGPWPEPVDSPSTDTSSGSGVERGLDA